MRDESDILASYVVRSAVPMAIEMRCHSLFRYRAAAGPGASVDRTSRGGGTWTRPMTTTASPLPPAGAGRGRAIRASPETCLS